ncbi:MAG TPA: transglutaminase domain-containing protein [Pedomonas sp.]|uniref:transglutaminase domain-containing protein n=1 Tax=Pedomonas sp. TaxID=2976421 RepID=UPI002F3FE253
MLTHLFLLRASQVIVTVAILVLLATLALFGSWAIERSRLHSVATSIAARSGRLEDQLAQLTAWVYANKGFEKNPNYFLWKRLDATPMQVLQHGGDCEDKSKLLSTLVQELGVPSTMAMLYHCEGDCQPVHTVTLAKTENGWTPLDAVYNITFRNRDGSTVPVEQMIRQPHLLNARLDQLAALRGPTDKITRYKRRLETYTHLTTVNWDKNALTRSVASVIRWFGGDPRLTPRPLFLDDPKQFFSIVGFILTVVLLLLAFTLDRIRRRLIARSQAGDGPAALRPGYSGISGG